MALLFFVSCSSNKVENKKLILYNNELGNEIASFPIRANDYFYVKFTHSVNMSPVIDYYKFNKDNEIYVYKTVYYNYGAGVETELENNETLSYGPDGSMIIENIDKKIDPLTYYLSDIFDHKLSIAGKDEISLWDICGKNILINIVIK
ncbi:MAG: DUF1850 domain-containing protein [Lachnospiraceae bacterium]|nr:DUF1850 domain-containing protein [Lachnospiraceae bacterium]